jgi:predicted transcriptional regulator
MATFSVQIAENTQRSLEALSEQTGRSVSEIIDKAIEEYRRKLFFEGVDRDFAALKANPEAWDEELEERRLFENTLMDGLDPDGRWTEDGKTND